MAYRKKRGVNRRKKSSGPKPGWVILALLLVAGAFYFSFDYFKQKPVRQAPAPTQPVPPIQTTPPAEGEIRQKIPPRPDLTTPVQGGYSSVPAVVPVPPAKKKADVKPGTVAIIVDDMGNSMNEARSLLAINLPITFSVIPGLPRAKAVAEEAHNRGAEVMLHIPMEPKEYLSKPFEKDGLLLKQDDREIERRIAAYLEKVPHAVGANNHMGSRFTEDRPKMVTVLELLKIRGMFFVDSKTTPASVAETVARQLGMPTAGRDVFLDNVQDVTAIRKQLDQAAAIARRHGSAIAICHPHPATIKALTAAMPELRRQGITFVKASALVS